MADKQALGARADLFAAHNSKQAHDVVAAVVAGPSLEQEGEDTTVAADSGAAAGGARKGRDAVAAAAADSKCPTR